APDLIPLLRACPDVRTLVTSRISLHCTGERVVPMPPLDMPESLQAASLEAIASSEAIRFFIARAAAARSGFALTPANAEAAVAICRRLDGLPLALELAAARTKVLSPAAILFRLNSRLDFLTGGARDLPARQQAMRAAIAWSHDLLTHEEQW